MRIKKFIPSKVSLLEPIAICMISVFPLLLFLIFYSLFVHFRCTFNLRSAYPVNFTLLPQLNSLFFGQYIEQAIRSYRHGFLIFLAVIPYMFHYFLPWFFVIALVVQRRYNQAVYFGILIGLSSFSAFLFQLFLPTSPPWAVDLHVNKTQLASMECDGLAGTIPASIELKYHYAAEFGYFYEVYGIPFVSNIFSLNKAVFGAFPSVHASWVLCTVLLGGWHSSLYWVSYLHLLWISWAVMYANHHYFVDIIGGILFVLSSSFLMYVISFIFTRTRERYYRNIQHL